MTKSELIAALSAKQPQLDYRDVELAVKELIEHMSSALAAGESEEFVLYHLRRPLEQLDTLTGATSVDDLLGRIFGAFCIGK